MKKDNKKAIAVIIGKPSEKGKDVEKEMMDKEEDKKEDKDEFKVMAKDMIEAVKDGDEELLAAILEYICSK